ncbi:MAG: cation-translocating P-type ATPase [Candidatus Brocadiia bacterium]
MSSQLQEKLIIRIGGMHCPSCALGIEKYVSRLQGITGVTVNFIKNEAVIIYIPKQITPETIKKAISKTGYQVQETLLDISRVYWNERIFWIRVFFTGLLIISAWIIDIVTYYTLPLAHIFGRDLALSDILSLVAISVGGYPVFKGALRSSVFRDITVFSLIAIASIAAILVGSYKEAAMVILIMLVGEALEQSALNRTRRTIAELVHLTPQTALIRRSDNDVFVKTEDLVIDDIVIIKPGDRIPVDGVIVKGEGSINEATLTGESLCLDKKTGDNVYGGTINENGAFEMRITAVGEHTRLGLIKRLIEEAESQKAPVQRLADKYARYFFPLILVITVIVFFITNLNNFKTNGAALNYYAAITVLIASCPCALVLATPTAVVCGLSNAAKQGILVKGGQFLEALGIIDTMLIDKTGTLTTGRLTVSQILVFNGVNEKELISLAATAENNSEHPLAKTILAKAKELNADIQAVDRFESARGLGVKVIAKDDTIWVGNNTWLKRNNIDIDANTSRLMDEMANSGQTILAVAHRINDSIKIVGLIGVKDTPRPIAARSMSELKNLGINKIVMITGDNEKVARSISRDVGIDEYYANMLPEDKVNKVRELKQQKSSVGMVGDGVNDAPALAAADVGIAMGAIGSAVAIESADVSLMSDDLSRISLAIKLSRRVREVIKQNFIFAIIYNIVIISLTSLYVHHQSGITYGAVAHQFSSLLVIFNSLRILKWSR